MSIMEQGKKKSLFVQIPNNEHHSKSGMWAPTPDLRSLSRSVTGEPAQCFDGEHICISYQELPRYSDF